MERRLRILMLNYEHPPIGGGAANAFRHILAELARLPGGGPEIHLVTSGMGDEDTTEADGNQHLHRLAIGKQALHFWTQPEILRWLRRGNRRARRLLKAQPFDLCHAVFAIPAGAIAWRLKRRLPYLVSIRGSDVPGFNERFRWQYHLLRPLIRRIWRSARAVVANSEGLRALALQTAPRQEISIIPNGVDTERFRPAAPANGDAGPLAILSVARLIRRKGIDDLLQAAAILAEERQVPPFSIELVGAGSQRENLEELTATLGLTGQVSFRGEVPNEELPGYYRRAAVFCLPSRYEGMSNALLEALASGLPVVVTTACQAGDLVTAANGVAVPPRDPPALARALARFLGDADERARAGATSRHKAAALGWEQVARSYLDLYHRIVTDDRQ